MIQFCNAVPAIRERRLWVLSLLLSLVVSVDAADMQDVIHMKNGGVIRGMIVEQVPGQTLTIVTADGNRFVFKMDEVQRITKEPMRPARRAVGAADGESWYMVWGVGMSSVSYGKEVDQTIEFLEGLPGVDRTTLALDLLGVYFPTVDRKTLLGGIVNAFGDRLDYGSEWFQINGATYSGSVVHFPQGTIGRGPFLRADLGPARMNVDGSEVTSSNSDWGFGGLVGGGLAYPVTSGTRFALTVSYAFRRIEGDDVGAWSAVVSGVF